MSVDDGLVESNTIVTDPTSSLTLSVVELKNTEMSRKYHNFTSHTLCSLVLRKANWLTSRQNPKSIVD